MRWKLVLGRKSITWANSVFPRFIVLSGLAKAERVAQRPSHVQIDAILTSHEQPPQHRYSSRHPFS
jgi:hypothetical protein